MAEFNIRTDAVDVEQIMRQIRARIHDKRGVDYTEEQIREMASVKLEKFLDPKGVRSDLVEQFRSSKAAKAPPLNYRFEDTTLFDSHRGLLRLIRRLLRPVLKLFFNPNAISHVLHMQSQINERIHVRDELDTLYYEVIHNLALETTRLGIEVKNLKMRVESLSSRLDFDERRARALEGVVQYKAGPTTPRTRGRAIAPAEAAGTGDAPTESAPSSGEDDAGGTEIRRRRRRRRGRRGRGSTPSADAGASASGAGEPVGELDAGDGAVPDSSTPSGSPTGGPADDPVPSE